MRVGVDELARVADANRFEHGDRPIFRLDLIDLLVQDDRLGDLVANRVHRRKRGHRLLKDHGDLVAANVAHQRSGRVDLSQVNLVAVAPPEHDFPVRDRGDALGQQS